MSIEESLASIAESLEKIANPMMAITPGEGISAVSPPIIEPEKSKRKRRTKAEIEAEKPKLQAKAEPNPVVDDILAGLDVADDVVPGKTIHDVRDLLTQVVQKFDTDRAKDALAEAGQSNLSDIPTDQFDVVCQVLQATLDG